jgi:hypothetical protein
MWAAAPTDASCTPARHPDLSLPSAGRPRLRCCSASPEKSSANFFGLITRPALLRSQTRHPCFGPPRAPRLTRVQEDCFLCRSLCHNPPVPAAPQGLPSLSGIHSGPPHPPAPAHLSIEDQDLQQLRSVGCRASLIERQPQRQAEEKQAKAQAPGKENSAIEGQPKRQISEQQAKDQAPVVGRTPSGSGRFRGKS